MITQYEVPQVINEALREEIRDLRPYAQCFNLDLSFDFYTSVNNLTEVTKKAIVNHQLTLMKYCITVAEKLFKEGDLQVRNVLENTFIYELSAFIDKSEFPKSFYKVYMQQVMASH